MDGGVDMNGDGVQDLRSQRRSRDYDRSSKYDRYEPKRDRDERDRFRRRGRGDKFGKSKKRDGENRDDRKFKRGGKRMVIGGTLKGLESKLTDLAMKTVRPTSAA